MARRDNNNTSYGGGGSRNASLDVSKMRNSPLFFLICVVGFTFWPVSTLVASSGVLRRTYSDASTLYANPFTYSELMPSAGHIFTLAITAAMYIHRGVSTYVYNNDDHHWKHTSLMSLSFPLYAGGLIAWCYDQPWVTFGMAFGALIFAVAAYAADSIKPTAKAFKQGAGTDGPHTKLEHKAKGLSWVTLILCKLPIRVMLVFLYCEAMNAFLGAATLKDADLAWRAEHWYVLFQCLFLVGAATVYFYYLNFDAITGFTIAGFLIQTAVIQRGNDPTGYMWVVTYAIAIYHLLASAFVGSCVINDLDLDFKSIA